MCACARVCACVCEIHHVTFIRLFVIVYRCLFVCYCLSIFVCYSLSLFVYLSVCLLSLSLVVIGNQDGSSDVHMTTLLDLIFNAMVLLYGLEDATNIKHVERFKREIKVL